MTDSHDDTERPDPVLVRPYVKPVPAKPARDPADAPTIVQPAITDDPPDEPPPAPPRRRSLARVLALRLAALIGGVALALAVAAWLIFHPTAEATQPGAALPQFTATLPAQPTAGSAHPSASRSTSPSPSASSSASPSVSAGSASAAPSASAVSTAPSAALAPPPSADRTGAVRAASGRCLMLAGLLGLSGSAVEVSGCADVAYQRFTLAADGTLRVNGRCAQVAGDSTVRAADCGSAAAAQWRAGPASSLVNPASGQCLSDPGQSGATTRVAACTGAADQSWSLP